LEKKKWQTKYYVVFNQSLYVLSYKQYQVYQQIRDNEDDIAKIEVFCKKNGKYLGEIDTYTM